MPIPARTAISCASVAGKIYDLMCNNNVKKVVDMDMDGHDVQEIHYYYKGICKHCIEEERLRTTKNN